MKTTGEDIFKALENADEHQQQRLHLSLIIQAGCRKKLTLSGQAL